MRALTVLLSQITNPTKIARLVRVPKAPVSLDITSDGLGVQTSFAVHRSICDGKSLSNYLSINLSSTVIR